MITLEQQQQNALAVFRGFLEENACPCTADPKDILKYLQALGVFSKEDRKGRMEVKPSERSEHPLASEHFQAFGINVDFSQADNILIPRTARPQLLKILAAADETRPLYQKNAQEIIARGLDTVLETAGKPNPPYGDSRVGLLVDELPGFGTYTHFIIPPEVGVSKEEGEKILAYMARTTRIATKNDSRVEETHSGLVSATEDDRVEETHSGLVITVNDSPVEIWNRIKNHWDAGMKEPYIAAQEKLLAEQEPPGRGLTPEDYGYLNDDFWQKQERARQEAAQNGGMTGTGETASLKTLNLRAPRGSEDGGELQR